MKVGKKSKYQYIYSQRSTESIHYAVSQIKKSKIAPYVKYLYLYGSCARREQTIHSDFDLFMVLSPDIDMNRYKDDIILLKSKVIPLDMNLPEVDLKVVVGDKWIHSISLYFKNVKNEGVNIWDIQ